MIQNISNIACHRTTSFIRFFNTTAAVTSSKILQSTRDDTEILKFKQKAKYWWDEQGEMKELHSMNSIRVPFILDCLKKTEVLNFEDSPTPFKDLNILDVGCGGGFLCEPLSQLGANVTGIDACEEVIEIAKIHSAENCQLKNKITYINDLLENIVPIYKNKFDAVVSSECIEHVNLQDLHLKSCVDVLKPGGSLVLTTINRTTLSWLIGILAAENVLKVVPKGTHEWNKFISPAEVTEILKNNGCQTQIVNGFTYNFISKKWLWIKSTSISYALHAVKYV